MLSKDTFKFLKDLENNNNRNWFLENKPKYLKFIKEPLKEICENLKPDFGQAHIYRPNRDMRFSKDKKPYKTQASFFIKEGAFGYYFQISKNSIMLAGGIWDTEKDQLLNWRNIFLEKNKKETEQVKKYLELMKKSGFEITKEDALKTAPRGFDKNNPNIEYLRFKHLALIKEYKVEEWAYTDKLLKTINKDFDSFRDWNSILNKNVGPTRIVRVLPPVY